MTTLRHLPSMGIACVLLAAGLPAAAQFKVVGPDGRITYTDRPPPAGQGSVTSIGRSATAASAAAGEAVPLPLDLRQVASRFPVVFYAGTDCPPCDQARQWLQQRGIPYAEKRVASDDDAAALDRLVGGRTIPSLTIGGQALRGFAPADWAAYLDAASYPKESRLPRGWQPAPATPVVERSAVQAAAPSAVRTEVQRPVARPVPPPPPAAAPDEGEPAASEQEPKIRF